MKQPTRIWILAALLATAAASPSAQEAGEAGQAPLSPAEEELFDLESLDEEPARRDSLRRARGRGYGWLDSLYGAPDDEPYGPYPLEGPAAAGPDSVGEAWPLFPPRSLDYERLALQDLLRSAPLPEAETESWTDVFRVDSLLALSLLQVREEAWPCYYPYSDLWIYIWRGWGQLLRGEREDEYSPGQLFQVPAGTIHRLRNVSGAPTVALVWSSPPADSVRVRIMPEELQEQLRADSLRALQMEDRILYRSGRR